jgi:hypothetical protein
VCEQAGIVWERPRNLLLERFPAVLRHYLLGPVKPPPAPPGPTVRGQVRELARYTADGWRGVGV